MPSFALRKHELGLSFLIFLAYNMIISVLGQWGFSPHEIWAELSPSFDNQQINDPLSDWEFVSPGQTNNISKCKTNDNDFPYPDIQGVDYVSDGRTLNTTLWLTSEVSRPTTDKFNEDITIGVDTFKDMAVDNYLNYAIDFHNSSSYGNLEVIESNITSLPSGLTGYSLTMSESLPHDTKIKSHEVGIVVENKQYYIMLSAEQDKFSNYLPKFHRIIDSLEIESNNGTLYTRSKEIPGFLRHYNTTLGIDMLYPSNWTKSEVGSQITFFAPNDDGLDTRQYDLGLSITSIYDVDDTDYYLWTIWDSANQTWTKEVVNSRSDISIDRPISIQGNVTEPIQEGGRHINMSLDLGLFNYPDNYIVFPFIIEEYTIDQTKCVLVDSTNLVSLPPPQYNLTLSSTPVNLRSGDKITLPLTITTDANVPSDVLFWISDNADLELRLDPELVLLSVDGSGGSSLEVIAPNNISGGIKTAYITGNATLSPLFVPSDAGSKNNQFLTIPVVERPLQINIQPLEWYDHLRNILVMWITPLAPLWGFLGGVAAVLIPLIARWYDKRRKRIARNGQPDKEIDPK